MRDYSVIVMEYKQHGCRGSVGKYQDGYLVLIDPDLSDDTKLETIRHELTHIVRGHLDHRKHLSIEEKETEAQ